MDDIEITLYLRPEWARAAGSALRDYTQQGTLSELSNPTDQKHFHCVLIDLKEALAEAGY